jgi:hypothetical protein
LLLASLYVLTVQVYRSDRLALAVVALALTLPVISAGSILMTIDAPYCCLWGWSLVFVHHALFGRAAWSWAAAGACIALGVLAKHTMVLFPPLVGLYLLMTPAVRGALTRPGFWLMTATGALGGLPILIWNAQHDWVTLKHTRSHAGMQEGPFIHPLGPFTYLGLQFALLLGFWFVGWVRAMWDHRPTVETRAEVRYLWWLSVPMIAFFAVFSLKNGGGEPNWPITGYLSGTVLMAAWLADQLRSPSGWYRRLSLASTLFFCGLGLLLTIAVHDTSLVRPLILRCAGSGQVRRFDPTCRLRGWHVLAQHVDRVRAELQREGNEPTIAASWWIYPGELGFYGAGHPRVYSVGLALSDRHSQYDLWHPNPLADADAFRGDTFIIVGATEDKLWPAFESVETRPDIVYSEDGIEISRWALHVCHGYRGFPPPTTAKH